MHVCGNRANRGCKSAFEAAFDTATATVDDGVPTRKDAGERRETARRGVPHGVPEEAARRLDFGRQANRRRAGDLILEVLVDDLNEMPRVARFHPLSRCPSAMLKSRQ